MIHNDLIARKYPVICDPTTAKYARVEVVSMNCAHIDPDTGSIRQDANDYALMSTPSINRKIRDYLTEVLSHKIYFMRDIEELLEPHGGGHQLKDWAFHNGVHDRATALKTFTDIRLMGGVLTLNPANKNDAAVQKPPGDPKNGQILGAMQVGIAISSEPVLPTHMSITRLASDEAHAKRTMGTKVYIEGKIVFYFPVRYCAHMGKKNNTSFDDLAAYWTALVNGFEHRTSSKGQLICTKLKVACFDTEEGAFDPDSPPPVTTVTNIGPAAGLDDYLDKAV